jgi:hypothetical protein
VGIFRYLCALSLVLLVLVILACMIKLVVHPFVRRCYLLLDWIVLDLLVVGNIAFLGVRFLVYVDVVAHLVHVVGLDFELIHVFG